MVWYGYVIELHAYDSVVKDFVIKKGIICARSCTVFPSFIIFQQYYCRFLVDSSLLTFIPNNIIPVFIHLCVHERERERREGVLKWLQLIIPPPLIPHLPSQKKWALASQYSRHQTLWLTYRWLSFIKNFNCIDGFTCVLIEYILSSVSSLRY